MEGYVIKKCNKGYVIHTYDRGGFTGEMWAFTTLKKLREFLPELFEVTKND